MLLRPLLAAAGLTAATQAFLLPPEISSHDVDIVESIPFETAAVAQAQTVDLDCPGCPPVFNKHHGKPNKHHGQQHNSHLKLDFSIDRAAAGDRLMLNGFELYPHSDPFTNVLVAPQVAEKPKHHKDHKDHKEQHEEGEDDDASKALLSHHKFRPGEKFVVEQQLGFSLHVRRVETAAEEALGLVIVDLQIIEVGSVFVDGLANMRINLIKTPDNELLIGKIEQTASDSVSTPMEDEKECTTTLCKWKAIIADKLSKMKMHGCHGMMGAKADHDHGHGHGHGHARPHQSNGLFDKPHGWTLLFRKLTSHIILPVLVGIVAGVTVSIVGMIIGTLLVGVWRKFVRGQSFFPQHRRRSHSGAGHHKASRMEAAAAEEKAGLMQEHVEEVPPAYVDEEVTIVEERAPVA